MRLPRLRRRGPRLLGLRGDELVEALKKEAGGEAEWYIRALLAAARQTETYRRCMETGAPELCCILASAAEPRVKRLLGAAARAQAMQPQGIRGKAKTVRALSRLRGVLRREAQGCPEIEI